MGKRKKETRKKGKKTRTGEISVWPVIFRGEMGGIAPCPGDLMKREFGRKARDEFQTNLLFCPPDFASLISISSLFTTLGIFSCRLIFAIGNICQSKKYLVTPPSIVYLGHCNWIYFDTVANKQKKRKLDPGKSLDVSLLLNKYLKIKIKN